MAAKSSIKKDHLCEHCDEVLPTKAVPVLHMRRSDGDVCGNRYVAPCKLKSHRGTHVGEKRFACTDCYKKFNRKGDLTVHLRTHSGERPFACNECKKTFKNKSDLSAVAQPGFWARSAEFLSPPFWEAPSPFGGTLFHDGISAAGSMSLAVYCSVEPSKMRQRRIICARPLSCRDARWILLILLAQELLMARVPPNWWAAPASVHLQFSQSQRDSSVRGFGHSVDSTQRADFGLIPQIAVD